MAQRVTAFIWANHLRPLDHQVMKTDDGTVAPKIALLPPGPRLRDLAAARKPPLLFDEQYQPKPAHFALQKLLASGLAPAELTRLSQKSDDGESSQQSMADQPPIGPTAPPVPLAFWKFQEPLGSPRVSEGLHSYALTDGDPVHPVSSTSSGGLFGPRALNFTASSPTQRLRAERRDVPALTVDLAGPSATVSLVAWVKRPTGRRYSHGFLAGVWGDADGAKGATHRPQSARQYAMYFDLGACNGEAGHSGVVYNHGLAAHIFDCGGATPGHPYCVTAACDPRPLPTDDWTCVANVYDGKAINAFMNATLARNGAVNPYPYPGGIYSPEKANRSFAGAEFGVGVSMSFGANQYTGLLGGLAVFGQALSAAELRQVCDWPASRSRTEV